MLRLRVERDLADRLTPMLVVAGEIGLEDQSAVPRDEHRMHIALLPIVEPFHHRTERRAGEADAFGRRHRPLVGARARPPAIGLRLCELQQDGNPQ